MENQNDRITTKHKTHQKSTNMPVYRMQITFKMSPRRRSKMTKPKSQIYRMQSPLKWILEEVKNLMREKTEMPVPTPERLPWLLSTLSEKPIYLLLRKSLAIVQLQWQPFYCIVKLTFLCLEKKIAPPAANVTRGLTYEKPDIESYAPTLFNQPGKALKCNM